MTVRRILFVDDEQHILDGLGNLLRKQRKRWEMVFALGAEPALAELRKGSFDVVVSDMRMPGMDGAAFLSRVKADFPSAARIILSGHAERDAVVAAVAVAHQFLSKPCTGEALTSVIERTCALQCRLQDERVRGVIGRLDKLPSAPGTYLDLVRAAADPDTGIADLARIVERDPAMAIKVLQLVNSAFFGLAHTMASVSKAVNYLGADLLKGLALSAQVFEMADGARVPGFSLEQLQRQSLFCGRLAGRFVTETKGSEEALTAGFVGAAGKIVLCRALPEEFARVIQLATHSRRAFHLVERELLGVTHAEIGAYLLGVWGLPFQIVEAVAYQHSPSLVTEGTREVLAAVHVATVLSEELQRGSPPSDGEGGLDLAFLAQVGLSGSLSQWRSQAELAFASLDGGAASMAG